MAPTVLQQHNYSIHPLGATMEASLRTSKACNAIMTRRRSVT